MHAEEKQLQPNQGGGQYSKDNWRHEAGDKAMRRRTTVRMYELLIDEFIKNDKYSVEWKRKLPLLVRRLELMHYSKSSSKEVYMDVCPKKMMKQLKTPVRDIYMEKEANANEWQCLIANHKLSAAETQLLENSPSRNR